MGHFRGLVGLWVTDQKQVYLDPLTASVSDDEDAPEGAVRCHTAGPR